MKIVIDINEHIYEQIMADSEVYVLDNEADRILIENAIYNGTPLPEHHGRLIDADDIMNDIKNDINEMTNIGIGVDGQYLWGKLNDAIYNAPTIIESDKE
jgi:hypothetical protein